jgi:hypothetical protein
LELKKKQPLRVPFNNAHHMMRTLAASGSGGGGGFIQLRSNTAAKPATSWRTIA